MKTIILEEVPHNNHGCTGFGVEIETIDERTGIIIRAYSCRANCHGIPSNNGWKVNQKIELPRWCPSWNEANIWIEDNTSFSNAGCTKLSPNDLVLIQ